MFLRKEGEKEKERKEGWKKRKEDKVYCRCGRLNKDVFRLRERKEGKPTETGLE